MPGWSASSASTTSERVAPSTGDLGRPAGVGAQDGRDPDGDAHALACLGGCRDRSARRAGGGTRPGSVGWSRSGPTSAATASRVFSPSPVLSTTVSASGSSCAVRDQLAQHRRRSRRPRSRRRCPRSRASSRIAVDDLGVGHVLDRAAGAPDDVQHVRAVGRVADRERLGDGVRLDRPDDVVARLERRGDRRAAGRLGAEDPVRRVLDQAERDQLARSPCRPWSAASRTRSGRRPAPAAASRAARRSRSRGSWSPRRRTAAG